MNIVKFFRDTLVKLMLATSNIWPNRLYIQFLFFLRMKSFINLKSPKTFNEKLNWIKLYDRNPMYTIMADKYLVKHYVADRIGEEYVVPCYGIWDKYEEIDFSKLPRQFVLKATHDSSGATLCRDKEYFNFSEAKIKFNKVLKRNYYYTWREWPYRNIQPRIIADSLLDDGTGNELLDYKFWCFNGEPKYIYCTIKGSNIFENFYDMNFKPVEVCHGFPRRVPEFEKPVTFETMKILCRQLSKSIPFVRVDFFEVSGKLYFGEFTFFDWAGFNKFVDGHDRLLGDQIVLPKKIK